MTPGTATTAVIALVPPSSCAGQVRHVRAKEQTKKDQKTAERATDETLIRLSISHNDTTHTHATHTASTHKHSMTLHVPVCASGSDACATPSNGNGHVASSAAASPLAVAAATAAAAGACSWAPLVVPATRRRSAGRDATPAWLGALLRNEWVRNAARALVMRPLPPHLAAAAPPTSSAATAAALPPLVYAHQREVAVVSPG